MRLIFQLRRSGVSLSRTPQDCSSYPRVGKQSTPDWENNQLFDLLNKRYNDQKDTILIANQDREQFKATLGASLTSRMQEMGAIIECDWPSYR